MGSNKKGDKKDVIKAIAEKYKDLRPEKLFGYPIQYKKNESGEEEVSVSEMKYKLSNTAPYNT